MPVGSEREVDVAVAVDVECVDADVVGLGAAVDDDVLFPGGIFEPEDAIGVHDDDVFLAVAVDVRQQHRIADAQFLLQLLHAEAREDGGRPRGLALELERRQAAKAKQQAEPGK